MFSLCQMFKRSCPIIQNHAFWVGCFSLHSSRQKLTYQELVLFGRGDAGQMGALRGAVRFGFECIDVSQGEVVTVDGTFKVLPTFGARLVPYVLNSCEERQKKQSLLMNLRSSNW